MLRNDSVKRRAFQLHIDNIVDSRAYNISSVIRCSSPEHCITDENDAKRGAIRPIFNERSVCVCVLIMYSYEKIDRIASQLDLFSWT